MEKFIITEKCYDKINRIHGLVITMKDCFESDEKNSLESVFEYLEEDLQYITNRMQINE